MKNRTRETCTSGTVRDEGGNILIYSANDREDRGNVGIIRSPIRASILPDFHYRTSNVFRCCAGKLSQRISKQQAERRRECVTLPTYGKRYIFCELPIIECKLNNL